MNEVVVNAIGWALTIVVLTAIGLYGFYRAKNHE
jgi:hypothetical protein